MDWRTEDGISQGMTRQQVIEVYGMPNQAAIGGTIFYYDRFNICFDEAEIIQKITVYIREPKGLTFSEIEDALLDLGEDKTNSKQSIDQKIYRAFEKALVNKERTTMVQDVRNIFPTLSQESVEKFARKASDRKLTDIEFLTWVAELAFKGEVFLSYSQIEEMDSVWWKAVGKLPAEQQNFIQSVDTKMRLGQQITLEEKGLVSTYVGHGFSLLSQEDKDRYLYLRSEAIEEALKRE